MNPREIAIAAFYADSHPLIDKFAAANGLDSESEGFGVNLDELIAFAGLLPPEDLAE